MYYTFGDIKIHFYLYQGHIYTADWSGGNAAHPDRDRFVDYIHQKTGIDKIELNRAIKDCFGPGRVEAIN